MMNSHSQPPISYRPSSVRQAAAINLNLNTLPVYWKMNNDPNLFVEFFLTVPCTHEIDHAREEDSFGS